MGYRGARLDVARPCRQRARVARAHASGATGVNAQTSWFAESGHVRMPLGRGGRGRVASALLIALAALRPWPAGALAGFWSGTITVTATFHRDIQGGTTDGSETVTYTLRGIPTPGGDPLNPGIYDYGDVRWYELGGLGGELRREAPRAATNAAKGTSTEARERLLRQLRSPAGAPCR